MDDMQRMRGLWRATREANVARGRRHGSTRAEKDEQANQSALYLVAVAVGMVGATYASVPLYRLFCQATGFGGTTKRVETVEEKLTKRTEEQKVKAAERPVTVYFNADVAHGMPWKFVPSQTDVTVIPGESTLAFYTAENTSETPVTGVSTYNVSPQKAGVYFNKIQCFCFEEQRLQPKEKIDMPVFFYLDPEFASDPRMMGVNNITLSYTFFPSGEEPK